jgi:hypothetical protein
MNFFCWCLGKEESTVKYDRENNRSQISETLPHPKKHSFAACLSVTAELHFRSIYKRRNCFTLAKMENKCVSL